MNIFEELSMLDFALPVEIYKVVRGMSIRGGAMAPNYGYVAITCGTPISPVCSDEEEAIILGRQWLRNLDKYFYEVLVTKGFLLMADRGGKLSLPLYILNKCLKEVCLGQKSTLIGDFLLC